MASWRLLTTCLLFGLQLIACSDQSSTPSLIAPVMATDTRLPPTASSPTPTITITHTPTVPPIPTITWTPLPTIPPDEFPAALLDLLGSNAGCRLPCWLGIAPGQTTLSEALRFLAQFPLEISTSSTYRTYYEGRYHEEVSFGFDIDVPSNANGPVALFSSDGIIVSIIIHLEQYTANYQLNHLLPALGRPADIYVAAQASSPVPQLPPTILILDYSQNGVLIWYEFPTTRVGENLRFCLEPIRTNLELWDSDFRSPNTTPVNEHLGNIAGWPPKPLVEATALSVDSFYGKFSGSSEGGCLETPADLWP